MEVFSVTELYIKKPIGVFPSLHLNQSVRHFLHSLSLKISVR